MRAGFGGVVVPGSARAGNHHFPAGTLLDRMVANNSRTAEPVQVVAVNLRIARKTGQRFCLSQSPYLTQLVEVALGIQRSH